MKSIQESNGNINQLVDVSFTHITIVNIDNDIPVHTDKASTDNDINSDTENVQFVVEFSMRKAKCQRVDSGVVKEDINDGNESIRILSNNNLGEKKGMLQLGKDLYYPLSEDIPCLRYSRGIYVFPTHESGIYYAIIFPENTVNALIDKFEELISKYCDLNSPVYEEVVAPEEQLDVSIRHTDDSSLLDSIKQIPTLSVATDHFSNWIMYYGKYIGESLSSSATYIASTLDRHSENISQTIEKPEKDVVVPESVSSSFKVAKTVTGSVVTVSNGIVDGVGLMASKISFYIMSSLKIQSSDGFNDGTLKHIAQVGKSGFVAFSHIMTGLYEAGAIVGGSIERASIKIIHKKYGDNVARITSDSFTVTKDIASSAFRLKTVGVTRFVKTVGVNMAKNYVESGLNSAKHEEKKLNFDGNLALTSRDNDDEKKNV